MTADDQEKSKPLDVRTDVDYQVGYGRPPREHQFKKGGPSPNPKGRPRGANRRGVDLARVLTEPVIAAINGKHRSMPFFEAAVQVLKQKTLNGDVRAAKMVFELMKLMDMVKPPEEDSPVLVTINFVDPPKRTPD